ncbi:MAG: serine O-acetyltransferase [Eubacteriales bacterium]|nr:serine O-acetyltransferase [Eubacteriales bacterium]
MDNKNSVIVDTVTKLAKTYKEEPLFSPKTGKVLPQRDVIIDILRDLRALIFPGYFSMDSCFGTFPEHYIGYHLNSLFDQLSKQIAISFQYTGEETYTAIKHAGEVTERFFEKIPVVQNMLLKDVQAGFDGDPAAKSKEEIINSYPGLLAIYAYRIAHILYEEKVPFIPRIMTEYSHSRTGIDINPGATIGEYFFIDHGTGVVIGETTIIGNYVKLYQGVTLGALSTRKGQLLSNVKRHPTIGNHVTIYSNSSVLGGDTQIGDYAIIGGNTFITESIPAYAKVSAKSPELVIKQSKPLDENSIWEIVESDQPNKCSECSLNKGIKK